MNPVSGLLGLCRKSGQITLGAEPALQAIRAGKARLALLDAGASAGTRKKITDACVFRSVPLRVLPEGELSRACGKEGRMAAAVFGGTLCERLLELLQDPPA